MNRTIAAGAEAPFVLHFRSLFHSGRGFEFPCDAGGQVDLDAMSERIRNNYLYARAMIGREVAWPSVRRISEASLQGA
ncbi:hypothetical protein [Ramlibacter alkalitolerans]|uniref:Uncharacterized protein n=1 Tax=Ramlibacter alkalitolerans TaxID=2039631 RepID=A0ABS1JTF6_9BURK|nr:hypothetical protein [Ramlibacter alkalitolerans]MBL0427497.1 hypothetical protein [Ramlibacter alkalitolerans]